MNDIERLDTAVADLRGGLQALHVFTNAALPFLHPNVLAVLAAKLRVESELMRDALLHSPHADQTLQAFDRDIALLQGRIEQLADGSSLVDSPD